MARGDPKLGSDPPVGVMVGLVQPEMPVPKLGAVIVTSSSPAGNESFTTKLGTVPSGSTIGIVN